MKLAHNFQVVIPSKATKQKDIIRLAEGASRGSTQFGRPPAKKSLDRIISGVSSPNRWPAIYYINIFTGNGNITMTKTGILKLGTSLLIYETQNRSFHFHLPSLII